MTRDCRAGRSRASRRAARSSSACPGRIAIFQNAIEIPSSLSACWTRSWSPTDAPPVVIRMSAPLSRARRMPAVVASSVSAAMPRSMIGALAAGERHQGVSRWNRRSGRARRRARHHQLVAGGEDRDLRASADWQLRVIHAGGEREVALGEPGPFAQQHVAFREVDAGGADVPAPFGGFLDVMRLPSAMVSSWITTASAPSGTTPPVKIRTASPAPTVPQTVGPPRPRQ